MIPSSEPSLLLSEQDIRRIQQNISICQHQVIWLFGDEFIGLREELYDTPNSHVEEIAYKATEGVDAGDQDISDIISILSQTNLQSHLIVRIYGQDAEIIKLMRAINVYRSSIARNKQSVTFIFVEYTDTFVPGGMAPDAWSTRGFHAIALEKTTLPTIQDRAQSIMSQTTSFEARI